MVRGQAVRPSGAEDSTLIGPEQLAEKVVREREPCPQRLKPNSKQCTYRSAEALLHPKSSATPTFSASCEAVPFPKPFIRPVLLRSRAADRSVRPTRSLLPESAVLRRRPRSVAPTLQSAGGCSRARHVPSASRMRPESASLRQFAESHPPACNPDPHLAGSPAFRRRSCRAHLSACPPVSGASTCGRSGKAWWQRLR